MARFSSSLILSILVVGALLAFAVPAAAQSDTKPATPAFYTSGTPHAEALGWHMGCQAYSFNRFTFYEALEKIASMGLHYVEAYPGQKLGNGIDGTFDHNMPLGKRVLVKDWLKELDIKLVNYGVVGLPNDEAECRKVFDFAKDMGIQTICSEPPYDAFDLLDKLTEEYQINVALHNHPKPSKYWDYKTVLEKVEGHSKRIGSCADTGHWMRSGIDPLEAVKALEGRIISFHLKDLNEFDRKAHDVPWGSGKANMRAILEEVKRQGIEAVFSAEYEHNWENSVPEIAAGMKYVNEVAADLSKK